MGSGNFRDRKCRSALAATGDITESTKITAKSLHCDNQKQHIAAEAAQQRVSTPLLGTLREAPVPWCTTQRFILVFRKKKTSTPPCAAEERAQVPIDARCCAFTYEFGRLLHFGNSCPLHQWSSFNRSTEIKKTPKVDAVY